MTTITTNPVFHYRAGEETSDDAWKYLVNGTAGMDYDGAKEHLVACEAEYKTETGLPLPGAWRSAKSVLLRAMKHGIVTMNIDGPKGKTALEKDIKAATASVRIVNHAEVFFDMVDKARNYAAAHGVPFTVRID